MPRSKEGFIWTAKAGSTEGLSSRSVVPSTRHLRKSYDAIVIGAGFAGLVAARELSRGSPGAEVLLIEARDRIGGRTWTAQELGEDIEMGGTWVHWNQPHLYTELSRYGLDKALKPTVASINPAKSLHNFGTKVEEIPADFLETTERIARQFFSVDGLSSRDLLPYPHDPFREPALWRRYDKLSVRQRLDQLSGTGVVARRDREVFEAYVGLFGCCPLEDTSFVEVLRWYALSGHSIAGVYEHTSTYKLGGGGMTAFARAVLADFRGHRLFQTTVAEIDQDAEGVSVVTDGGERITASVVVSTIPLNCLSDIKFSPPLSPLRSEAAHHGHQNLGSKVHIKVSSRDPLWFATASINGPSPYLLAFADHNGTSQESGGTYVVAAGKTGGIKDHRDVSFAVGQFTGTFRPGDDVEAYLIHDWATDPYSKGEWSCWRPGAMSKYLLELQRPHGRVLFASSDWASAWRGFIDGALESGKQAARQAQGILDSKMASHL